MKTTRWRRVRFFLLMLVTMVLTSGILPNLEALPVVWQSAFPSTIFHSRSGAIAQQPIQQPIQQSDQVSPASVSQSPASQLVQAGKAYYDSEQFLAAAQTLQEAEALYASEGESLRQAQVLALQALAWQKLGEWDVAQEAIARSSALLSAIPSQAPDVNRIKGQVLNAQGHLRLALGKSAPALESWEAAEALYRQANAPTAALGSQINQAQALQSLGFYRRAENLIFELEKDFRNGQDSELAVKGLLNVGNVLRLGGEVERAKAVLGEGLAMAQRLQRPADAGQALLHLGNTEQVLATRAAAIRDEAAREQHARAALQFYAQAQASSPIAMTQIQAQLNHLGLLLEMNKLTEAQREQQQLLQSLPQLPASRAAIYARVNLAQRSIEMDLQAAPEIADRLAIAIDQARTLEDKRAESYALGALGTLYEKIGDRPNAQTATRSALSIAQAIRASDIAYQWQWQMGRLIQADTPDPSVANAEAIEYYTAAEKTLEGLRSDLVALNPDIQFSFRERVEPVYRELVDLLLKASEPTEPQLKQARDVMESLQLAELDNFFRDACADPQSVNVDDLDKTAAVVYPILLEDRLAVILKLPGADNLRYYAHSGVTEETVDDAVQQLLSELKRRSTPPAQLRADAEQFYQWLLAPFADDLEPQIDREQSPVKTLVFVLDGSLRNLPMSALYDGERYIIERYAIALTPGLQLLEPKALQPTDLRVLVAGATEAPSFSEAGLGALSNVDFEMAGVQAQLESTTTLKNEAFRQTTLRETIKNSSFNVVHLATHGNFSSNPDQTFLLDWEGRISANDIDTLFQVDDPSQENSVELLVLSACETATGDKRAALGLAGIAIRADVRSTLATLWQVNDASTAEFMIRFYQQLSQGTLTKAEALRNAQIAFLKEYEETDYNRPFHWAPFTLVGNWL